MAIKAFQRFEHSYYLISWFKWAIIHYEPRPKACAELDPNSMYLCDSGGQYLDGTTDITRTLENLLNMNKDVILRYLRVTLLWVMHVFPMEPQVTLFMFLLEFHYGRMVLIIDTELLMG